MAEHSRYRIEDGQQCIDVRVATIEHLFDNRDPAPFRDRDLDPDLLEYLVGAAEDVAPAPFRIVYWFTSPPPADRVEAAYHGHFAYELERLERRRKRDRRVGHVSLVVGLVLLVVLVSLAQLATSVPRVGSIVKEGLTISSWVILWYPVQILVYGWWPMRRERHILERLHAAPIFVRAGKGPEEPARS